MRYKFNPPPNWPPMPNPNWRPPNGWQPPAEWGPPPQGWQLWVPVKRSAFAHPAAIVGYVVAAIVLISVAGNTGDSGEPSAVTTPTDTTSGTASYPSDDGQWPTPSDGATDEPTDEPTPTHKPAAHKVIFRVWGSAPSGVDVIYGSDSDNRQGPSRPGFTRKLKVHNDALYYAVTAQLMGGGNIHCSVTIDGHTKKGHASGGYNICSAQLNQGLFGGWD